MIKAKAYKKGALISFCAMNVLDVNVFSRHFNQEKDI